MSRNQYINKKYVDKNGKTILITNVEDSEVYFRVIDPDPHASELGTCTLDDLADLEDLSQEK